MVPPETRYAKSGDVHIAYQVVGSGPLDLVHVPGFVSNIELFWEMPEWAHFFSRLAAFSRLILFDKRGTGLSNRNAGIGSLEERMDDVRAVMDAAGSERAALFGFSQGGSMSVLFAATYPQRAQALVLCGSFAWSPFKLLSDDECNVRLGIIDRLWGSGEFCLNRMVPSRAADDSTQRLIARFERQSASPSAAMAQFRMSRQVDIRHLLPVIQVPTLVIHQVGDTSIPVASGRELAANIPGAKYVELPGTDHWPFYDPGNADRIIDEIEEFLTGSRTIAEPDRVLATVLFTDIVDSTKRAAALGDHDWRLLLGRHDEAARQEIARFRGRAVKSLGDGFLATFDGPARAVRCAAAIVERMCPLGVEVRTGLHTGEIELLPDDIGGIAVHIAARVAELAGTREVLVSSTVRDLVAGSGLRFADRGHHALKGLPEPLHLFSAEA